LAIEGNLELIKKELGMRPDFNLAGVFRRFSDNTHGRINATELLFGLEQLGVACDIADARLIIDRYDADKDGRLGFWEFSNTLLPIQSSLRDELEMRKGSSAEFSSETKELL
jgi:Ca2+-binding EF-hand superfamily protein